MFIKKKILLKHNKIEDFMNRRNFYIVVASICIALTAFWLTIYAVISLDINLFQDPNTIKINGSGVKGEITINLNELKSSKYVQIIDQKFFIENSVGNTYEKVYSGVENLLNDDPNDLTFLLWGRDGYRSPQPLNLSIAKNYPTLVIIAYMEDSYPLFGDGPLRSALNQSVMPIGEVSSQYSVQQLAIIEIT
jgi:hypothetical protein